jgi:hypothetical protein
MTDSLRRRKGMKRILVVSLLGLFMLGCASAGRMNSVRLGMTKQQTLAVMGKPTSTSAKGEVEYLNYRLSRGLFRDDYYVRLNQGKVDAFGRAGDFGLGY